MKSLFNPLPIDTKTSKNSSSIFVCLSNSNVDCKQTIIEEVPNNCDNKDFLKLNASSSVSFSICYLLIIVIILICFANTGRIENGDESVLSDLPHVNSSCNRFHHRSPGRVAKQVAASTDMGAVENAMEPTIAIGSINLVGSKTLSTVTESSQTLNTIHEDTTLGGYVVVRNRTLHGTKHRMWGIFAAAVSAVGTSLRVVIAAAITRFAAWLGGFLRIAQLGNHYDRQILSLSSPPPIGHMTGSA